MRVGRVRGGTILEARQKRRVQRVLAAGQEKADRARSALVEDFQTFVAVARDVTMLAAERAESLDEFRLHQKGRFDTLARVHARVIRDRGRVDLETLVWDELATVMSPSEEDRVVISGPSVALEGRVAELVALLLHELSTNTVKFGALSEDEGRVEVSWGMKADGATFSLSWRESGAPAPARLPTRCGFGRELIETILPRQLRARTEFALSTAGLRCEVDLPLFELADQGSGEMAIAA